MYHLLTEPADLDGASSRMTRATPKKPSWSCPKCTLLNSTSQQTKCTACEIPQRSAAPHSVRVCMRLHRLAAAPFAGVCGCSPLTHSHIASSGCHFTLYSNLASWHDLHFHLPPRTAVEKEQKRELRLFFFCLI